jgi:hypothetical protein
MSRELRPGALVAWRWLDGPPFRVTALSDDGRWAWVERVDWDGGPLIGVLGPVMAPVADLRRYTPRHATT